MPGAQLYDTIGATYPVTRRTEPRIAEQIWAERNRALLDLEEAELGARLLIA